jgi:hypothetical protein
VGKWLNQVVVAVAVEAVARAVVKAEAVEVVVGPAKRASPPVVAEIMLLQKAND